MLMKQIIDAYEVLDSSFVTGEAVKEYLLGIKADANVEVYELVGPKGSTNIMKEVNHMAVKMRLKRMGKKRNPIYRIVVADARSPRDGRNIDEIGLYDPNQEPCVVNIDEEAAKDWLSKGAQPTDTVARLLKNAGIEK